MTGTDDLANEKAAFLSALNEPANPPAGDPPPPPADPPSGDPPSGDPPPPPADPPKGDSPAGDPRPIEFADADRVRIINEVMGTNYATLDEAVAMKPLIEKSSEYISAMEKYKELEATPVAKFHNEKIMEINTFATLTGIDDVNVINKFKAYQAAETKNPIDALVLAELIKDPSLAGKETILRKSIERQYNTKVDEYLEGDELVEAKEQAEIEQLRLDRTAAVAQKEIDQLMGKVKDSQGYNTYGQTHQQKSETKAQWEQAMEANMDKLFSKVPILVPKGKDAKGEEQFDVVAEVSLSKEEQKAYSQMLVENAVRSGSVLTQDALVKELSIVYDVIKGRNSAQVLSSKIAEAEGKLRLELEKSIHNPTQLKVETPATPRATEKTPSQVVEEKFNNWMNGG